MLHTVPRCMIYAPGGNFIINSVMGQIPSCFAPPLTRPQVFSSYTHDDWTDFFSLFRDLKWANFWIKISRFRVKIQFQQLFIPNKAYLLNLSPLKQLLLKDKLLLVLLP